MAQPNGASAGAPVEAASPSLSAVCNDMRRRVLAFLDERTADPTLQSVQKQTRVSMEVVAKALRELGPEHLALSYNGGKDCLVMLVLVLASLPAWHTEVMATAASSADHQARPPFPDVLPSVYVVSLNPFPEVEMFVAQSAREYRLDLVRYVDGMRAALGRYLAEHEEVRAVFIGTRRTDPHGAALTHFDPTDGGWPECMRVHPVIDWHYVEIWKFIKHLHIPFCKLYDMGYTSLGGMSDTHPNPALAIDATMTDYRPACELTDDDLERLGRE